MIRQALWVLFAALLITLVSCGSYTGYEALEICRRCGWTNIERREIPRAFGGYQTYCTRVRDGNSEIETIETVISQCPAMLKGTLESLDATLGSEESK